VILEEHLQIRNKGSGKRSNKEDKGNFKKGKGKKTSWKSYSIIDLS
jgi:hypothetical protein